MTYYVALTSPIMLATVVIFMGIKENLFYSLVKYLLSTKQTWLGTELIYNAK